MNERTIKSTKVLRIAFMTGVIITVLMTLYFVGIQSKAAAKTGTVNTDGLNVRTGAGTNFDILKVNDEYVRLSKNTKVDIKEELTGGWYRVTFTFDGKSYEGYVASAYVNTGSGKNADSTADKNMLAGNLNIAATMITKQKVYNKASKKGGYLQYNGKQIYVKKGANLKITGVYKVSKKRWYRITFTYKKNKMTGFINYGNVKLTAGSKVKSYINNKTFVYSKTSKYAYVKVKKKKVKLKYNKKINVTAEKTSSGIKWFKIRYVYGNKTRTGWVPAQNVMFISGKDTGTEESAKATDSPKATAKPTPRPVAALSDAEFEASMTAEGFPESYKNDLRLLHQKYPYWQFSSIKTGIDWNTAVDKESVPGKSLVPNTRTTGWKSTDPAAYNWTTDSYKVFDGLQWVAASREGVAYYMDPRNFLEEKYIFMFEALAYEENYQNVDGVATILNNTLFSGNSFVYTNETGTQIEKSYQDAIMEAGVINGVSPYHLASRIRQEVVTGTNTVSNSVTGTVSGYEGIYNFYNIGASDSAGGGAVQNGLKFASSGSSYLRPWNNPYKAIVGGAQYIANNYISRGQNTLYLERFNVTAKNTYDHQYMTNVAAAYSEASKVYTAYKDWMANVPILFYIPVYENMPEQACQAPTGNLNPNNYLRNLTVTGASGTAYAFTPAFDASNGGTVTYTVNVPLAEGAVTIAAETVNKNATVAGAGTVTLQATPVTVPIQVTAQDGNVRNYTLILNCY